ncbi:MAG: Bax inhibitor-1 family protein [Deltaproteobacteria bacterium]|nr:Bax inhibitor-1 family protein [Deltaproteobacteria bacterium]
MQQINTQNITAPVVASDAPLAERLAFLRKVYGLLSISIFLAAGASWMTINNENFLNLVFRNMMLFFIVEIAAIFFALWARKKENLGYIALFTFTILTGITTAPILTIYTGETVTNAAVLTGLVFAGLSLYTVSSKRDFSFMGGMLTTGLIVLIVGGLLNAFVFKSSMGSFMFSAGGVIIFSGFIIYDTFNILHRYPTDEYISATLSLYLDVLNLFLMLLRLLGGNRD